MSEKKVVIITGAAQDKALSVLDQLRLGYPGTALEIFEVRVGDELI